MGKQVHYSIKEKQGYNANLLFEIFNPLFERQVLLLEHLNELSFRMSGGLGFSYHIRSSLFTVPTSFGHRLRHQEAVDRQV